MSFGGDHPLSRIVKKLYQVISSREFLAWTIGGWILYYVSSMIWTQETFTYFMQKLHDNLWIQTPFVLFLISGYLNLMRSAVRHFRKNKWGFLPFLFLPLGLMVFFTGFFISATTRQFEWLTVGKGDLIQPKWSGEQYRVDAIDPGIKERLLDIDMESGEGLFKYEPKVTVSDRYAGTFKVGAFPPAKIGDTYFHILNFGLSPRISLSVGGEVKATDRVPLRILMPGSSDTFEIQPLPYKFLVSLEPEKTIQKGRLKASEFNIRSPLYRIRVLEGEKVIAEAVSKKGVSFGNMEVDFLEQGFWVQLEIVRDRGVPLIIGGIMLTLTGILFSLCGALFGAIRKGIPR